MSASATRSGDKNPRTDSICENRFHVWMLGKLQLDVLPLPNINRTQATEITPGSNRMVPSAGAWRHFQPARSIPSLPGVMAVQSAVFVPGELDLWPWHSNSSERGTKRKFGANSFSFFRDIWFTSKKQKVTDSAKTEPYVVHCVR